MRKFFTLIAFFAISTMAFAQSSQNLIMPAPVADKEIRASAVAGQASQAFNDIKIDVKPGDSFQSGTTVISIRNFYNGQIHEMGPEENYGWTYEPHSNTLFFMSLSRTLIEGDQVRCEGLIWYVNANHPDIANTSAEGPWRKLEMYNITQPGGNTANVNRHGWTHATVVASNPTKSTDVNDVYVGFVVRRTINLAGTTTTTDIDRWFGFNTVRNLEQGIAPIPVTATTPSVFNPSPEYTFHYMKGTSAVIDGKPIGLFHGYSRNPTRPDDSNQVIRYAFVSIDLSSTNEDDALENSQNLPPSITGIPSSIFNATIMEGTPNTSNVTVGRACHFSNYTLDTDNNGNVYFAFVNALSIHQTNEYMHGDYRTMRLPAVIKTKYTNDGSYGLNFNDMVVDTIPFSVIIDYINSNGGVANDNLQIPSLGSTWGFNFGFYTDGRRNIAFTVLGEDEYSFILPFYYNDGNDGASGNHFLQYVEVTSKNKVWTIRKIADILGKSPVQPSATAGYLWQQMHFYWSRPNEPLGVESHLWGIPGFFSMGSDWDITPPYSGYVYMHHTMRDLQVARTRDNQYLIAKWVSVHDSDAINLPDTMLMRWPSNTPYVIEVPRIFRGRMMMSWRDVNNPTWSTPVTVYCSDTISMLRTYMPRIVPSRTLVPVTYYKSLQGRPTPNPVSVALRAIHPIMANACRPEYALNDLILANAMVTFPCYNCIEEGDFTNVHNLEAFPNPPVNEITFRFSVVQPAHTTLVVTNALGQTIATVVDQFFEGGREYTTKFNTANLPIGTYYYTLTAGPRVETKMFTVVR